MCYIKFQNTQMIQATMFIAISLGVGIRLFFLFFFFLGGKHRNVLFSNKKTK